MHKIDDYFLIIFRLDAVPCLSVYSLLWWWADNDGQTIWWCNFTYIYNKKLRHVTETLCCHEHYAVIKVLNYLIVNVYLPCVGSVYRWLICSDIFADIQSWCNKFDACEVIIAGDFNCNLTVSGADKVFDCVLGFVSANSLIRCDSLFPSSTTATYIIYALNHQSYIDYVFTSTSAAVNKFEVHDPDVIFFWLPPVTFLLPNKWSGESWLNLFNKWLCYGRGTARHACQ